MRQRNPASPTIIEKFRQQREYQKRLLIVFGIFLVVGVLVPLGGQMIPIVRAQPIWRYFVNGWGCLLIIGLIGLSFAALFNSFCPACGKPIGEDFWTARYCQHCGAQLRED